MERARAQVAAVKGVALMGPDGIYRLQMALLAALAGYLLWLLAPVLTPFALAALLAYIADPLADRLERKMSRTLAVTLVFFVFLLLLLGLIAVLVPLLEHQVSRAISAVPAAVQWFRNTAGPWLQRNLHITPEALNAQRVAQLLQQHWQQAGGLAATVLGHVTQSGLALVDWAVNVVLVPVVFFYLLRDWDVLVARVRELLPRHLEPTIVRLAREADAVLGAFFKGQLLVMLGLGIYYGLALAFVGRLGLGPLIGILAGLVSFVPYLGFITGLLAAVAAVLVQYGVDWLHLVLVLGIFAVGQLLEGYVLVPRLVGERIGLHPVAVMFAILAGGQLFGFFGVLVALPLAAIVMVVLRYAHERYLSSALYARPPASEHGVMTKAEPPRDPPATGGE